MTRSELIEAMARGIAVADERNGGPPYEYRITLHKDAKAQLFEEAEAALSAIEQAGMVVVPKLPSFAEISALATYWGYSIEETADTYEMLVERFSIEATP